jgi:hypothetical protein
MAEPLTAQLWRLSEAGEPAVFLGRPHDPRDNLLLEHLLECGALQHAGRLTAWDVCAGCDCGAEERPIRERAGVLVAACPLDHSRDERLDPDDLLTFRINIAALVTETAAATGLSGPVEEVAPGMWRIGLMSDGRIVWVVPTRHTILQPGLVGTIRTADPVHSILLLGPALPQAERASMERQGIRHAVLHESAGTSGPDEALALDLKSLAAGEVFAARLVLYRSSRTVRLDGRPRPMGDQAFRLLLALAEAARQNSGFLAVRVLEEAVYRNQDRPAARELRDIVRELRNALSADLDEEHAGAAHSLIKNTRSPTSGYQLTLTREEIATPD